MNGCSQSTEYVRGNSAPISTGLTPTDAARSIHYLVDLTERHLLDFEVLNSMYLLNNYDHLMYFLESQLDISSGNSTPKSLVVPPYDILLVLLTLATVSEHYRDEQLGNNDRYNATRIPLNKRAIGLLRKYLIILLEFDVSRYNRYDLELLRCQVFLMVDNILNGGHPYTVCEKESVGQGNGRFSSPYSSYVTCMKNKQDVLGNTFLNIKLNSSNTAFLNAILWSLTTSLRGIPRDGEWELDSTDEREALFVTFHDVWLPVLNILIDSLLLRHAYFMSNEIDCPRSSGAGARVKELTQSYVQKLSGSPLALFFNKFSDSKAKFNGILADYILVNCPMAGSSDDGIQVHGVYEGEDTFSATYVSRERYTTEYAMSKSMELRRKLLYSCFQLQRSIPENFTLVTPRLNLTDFVKNMASNLISLVDMRHFVFFFDTTNPVQDILFLPLLAEACLTELHISNPELFDLSAHQEGRHSRTRAQLLSYTQSSLKLVSKLADPEACHAELLRELESVKLNEVPGLKVGILGRKKLLALLKFCVCIITVVRFSKFLRGDVQTDEVRKKLEVIIGFCRDTSRPPSQMEEGEDSSPDCTVSVTNILQKVLPHR